MFKFTKGQAMIASLIIAVTIAAVMVAQVAMPILQGTNTTGWSTTNITLFALLGTFLLISLIVAIAKATGLM